MKRALILFCLIVIQLFMMDNSKALVRDSNPRTKMFASYEVESKIEKELLTETNQKRKKQSSYIFKHTKNGGYKINVRFKLRNKQSNKKAGKTKRNERFKNKNSGHKRKKKKAEVSTNKKNHKRSTSKSKNTKGGNNEKNGKIKLKNKGRNKEAEKTKGNRRLNTKMTRHRGKKKEKGANTHKNRSKSSNNDKRIVSKKNKHLKRRNGKKKNVSQKKNKYKKKRIERNKIKYFKHKKKNVKGNKQQEHNNRNGRKDHVPDCDVKFMLDMINTDKKFRDALAKLQRMETWLKLLFSKQQAALGSSNGNVCGQESPPTFCIPFHHLDQATGPGGTEKAPPPGCGTTNGGTRCGCGPINSEAKNIYNHLSNCTESAAWACSRDNITYDRIWIPHQQRKPPCYNNNENSTHFGVAEVCCRKNNSCETFCSLDCISENIIDKSKTCKSNVSITCPVMTNKARKRGRVPPCSTNCNQTPPVARFVLTKEMMDHISDVCIPQLRNWTERFTACSNRKPEGDCLKACQTNLNFFKCQKNKCECEHQYLSNNEKERRCKFETCLYDSEYEKKPSTLTTVEKLETCQCVCYQQLQNTTEKKPEPNPLFPIDNTKFPPIPPTPQFRDDKKVPDLNCFSLVGFERLVKIRRDRCLLAGGIDATENAKTNPALNPEDSILPTLQAPPPGLGPGNGLKPSPRPDPLKECIGPDNRESRNFADCRYQSLEAIPWIYNCKGPSMCMSTSRFSSGRNKFLSLIKKLHVVRN